MYSFCFCHTTGARLRGGNIISLSLFLSLSFSLSLSLSTHVYTYAHILQCTYIYVHVHTCTYIYLLTLSLSHHRGPINVGQQVLSDFVNVQGRRSSCPQGPHCYTSVQRRLCSGESYTSVQRHMCNADEKKRREAANTKRHHKREVTSEK